MTRKHFEALARALASTHPTGLELNATERWQQWNNDRKAIADACAAFNGNFDRARFMRATEE